MAILMSLLTSAIYGVADFAGGKATRRSSVLVVIIGAHVLGLIGVTSAAVLLARDFSAGDFVLGGIGGLGGLVGLALLYRRLALGPMMIVAPITAITSAALPAAWGIWSGDSLSVLTLAGVALAFVAIGLVSLGDAEETTSSGPGAQSSVTVAAVGESLLAGAGFGTMFVFLSETDAATAPWPVVGSRVVSVALLLALLALRWPRDREAVRGVRPDLLGLIALTGVLDVAANVTFLLATGEGDLTTVAVLSSLYPVATMLLALAIDQERVNRIQVAGLVAALVATALISAG